MQIMKPPLLVIFENIQYLHTKKREKKKENYSVMEIYLYLAKTGMEKMQLTIRILNLRTLYLQSHALPTELAGHQMLG
jgi:hypothetical protein